MTGRQKGIEERYIERGRGKKKILLHKGTWTRVLPLVLRGSLKW